MVFRKNLKNLAIKLVPDVIKRSITYTALEHINISYAQEGEDIILDRFLNYQKSGFYIDVGAHHPTRFSNTYLFYKRGWCGINIDAMPGSMTAFSKVRPNDINLETPISLKKQALKYCIFNEPALNTFSEEEAIKKAELENYQVLKTIVIETFPLSYILDKHLPHNQSIDFMSIDVEGLDLEVLKSNNWTKYRPRYILIESLSSPLEDIYNNDIYLYIKQLNYDIVAKTCNTLFFKITDNY